MISGYFHYNIRHETRISFSVFDIFQRIILQMIVFGLLPSVTNNGGHRSRSVQLQTMVTSGYQINPLRLPNTRKDLCRLGKRERELVLMLLVRLSVHYVRVTLSCQPLPAWCQMDWLWLVIVALPKLFISVLECISQSCIYISFLYFYRTEGISCGLRVNANEQNILFSLRNCENNIHFTPSKGFIHIADKEYLQVC